MVPINQKVHFWMIIGALSVFFAEIVNLACPMAFFSLWGILVVFPLYALHCLVLSSLIFRDKKPSFYILFLAGAIFGMYEAYITKVIWNPTWGDCAWTSGGIYLVQTGILILFWHPLMAFILPLFLAESLFTSSSEILGCFPGFVKTFFSSQKKVYAFVGLAAFYFSATQSISSNDFIFSILNFWPSLGLIFLLGFLWEKDRKNSKIPMRKLLPEKMEFKISLGLLGAFYLVWGVLLRPEALPKDFGPHLTVWGIYFFLFGLLFLNLRRQEIREELFSETIFRRFSGKLGIFFGTTFSLFSVFFLYLKSFTSIVQGLVLLTWLVGIGTGTIVVLGSAVRILIPSRKSESVP